MIRVFVLYPEAPDPQRYERHVELARREVPEATTRHGRVFGSVAGKSDLAYYFEDYSDRSRGGTPSQTAAGSMPRAASASSKGRPSQVGPPPCVRSCGSSAGAAHGAGRRGAHGADRRASPSAS